MCINEGNVSDAQDRLSNRDQSTFMRQPLRKEDRLKTPRKNTDATVVDQKSNRCYDAHFPSS